MTINEVLEVLDRDCPNAYSCTLSESGHEVIVRMAIEMPPEKSGPILKRAAEALSQRGYSCTRSRTRVSVMRAGNRTVPARIPDVICRRER